MVDFAGYALPVQYRGIIAEHEQARRAAALFDVSHMGQGLDQRRPGGRGVRKAWFPAISPGSASAGCAIPN